MRKPTLPVTPWRLVLVEWEDSQRPLAQWQWVDEYILPEAVRVISVGWMIAKTKTALALAPNLGELEQPHVQACGIIRIPMRAVIRIVDLSKGERVARSPGALGARRSRHP